MIFSVHRFVVLNAGLGENLMSKKIRADANCLHFLNQISCSCKGDANANIPVRLGFGECIMQVDFATPKKSMYMLIDTGSDVLDSMPKMERLPLRLSIVHIPPLINP